MPVKSKGWDPTGKAYARALDDDGNWIVGLVGAAFFVYDQQFKNKPRSNISKTEAESMRDDINAILKVRGQLRD